MVRRHRAAVVLATAVLTWCSCSFARVSNTLFDGMCQPRNTRERQDVRLHPYNRQYGSAAEQHADLHMTVQYSRRSSNSVLSAVSTQMLTLTIPTSMSSPTIFLIPHVGVCIFTPDPFGPTVAQPRRLQQSVGLQAQGQRQVQALQWGQAPSSYRQRRVTLRR